jgi:UDP-N-acetylglucosamine 2-epimerase (hydrolysing)
MKKILFVTGTRADFGKLKPLIKVLKDEPEFEVSVFVTGMHTLSKYGNTQNEVLREGFSRVHIFHNQIANEPMDQILANTVIGLSRYIHENQPDMMVIHGDRVEALAGAIVGSINNLLTVHVEGGERSGTIDELIRHSVSKLAHLHLVANEDAALRVRQLGESDRSIFIIGSPDIDVMASKNLPSIEAAKERYNIPYARYGVFIYHPVTSELDFLERDIHEVATAIRQSKQNWVVVFPNNDAGSDIILRAYREILTDLESVKIFPSIRFEYFLVLLKNADILVGNSSCGIREAPYYGLPTLNIGTRQSHRSTSACVTNVPPESARILPLIEELSGQRHPAILQYGEGTSAQKFLKLLHDERVWQTPTQKIFVDLPQP